MKRERLSLRREKKNPWRWCNDSLVLEKVSADADQRTEHDPAWCTSKCKTPVKKTTNIKKETHLFVHSESTRKQF